MKTPFKILGAAALVAATALYSLDSFANPNHHKGTGMGMGPDTMSSMMENGSYHWTGGMATIDQGKVDQIEKALKLTDKQKPLWDAYIKAAKEAVETMRTTHESMDPKAIQEMSVEDRQQFMQSMMETRQEELNSVTKARQALVNLLSDEQKQTAQAVLSDAMSPGQGMGMGGHMGMMTGGSGMMEHMKSEMHGGYGGMHGGGYGGHHGGGGMWPYLRSEGGKDLSIDNVKDILEGQLAWYGNERLKVGKVTAKGENTAIAEIVTVDGSLVDKVQVDLNTGRMVRID